jgi:hypothetical protein
MASRASEDRGTGETMTKRTERVDWVGGSSEHKRANSWAERGWRAVLIDAADGEGPFVIPWVLDAPPSFDQVKNGRGLTLMFSGAVEDRILISLVGHSESGEVIPTFTFVLLPSEIRRFANALQEARKHAQEIIRVNQLHPGPWRAARAPRWFRKCAPT